MGSLDRLLELSKHFGIGLKLDNCGWYSLNDYCLEHAMGIVKGENER